MTVSSTGSPRVDSTIVTGGTTEVAPEKPKLDLLSDEAFFLDDLPPPPTRPVKKPRFTLRALGASKFGRRATSLAVVAAVFGAMLGDPTATTNNPGPTIEAVAREPQGSEIRTITETFVGIGELIAPGGIPREEVFSRLGHLSFSVQLDDGIAPGEDGTGLAAAPGTRLQVNINRGGFSISGSPAAEWRVDWRPDPEVRSIRYDFDDAGFTADASGFGYDSWYEESVADATNQRLRPRLPPAMREAGYDPWTDPDLEANLQRIVDLFRGGDATSGAKLSAPHFGLSFRVNEDQRIRIPTPDGHAYAYVDAGTTVRFHARTTGPLEDVQLDSIHLSFSQPIEIMEGEERDAVMARMDLNGVTIRPGADVTLHYDLGAEETLDGIKGLGLLFLVAAEPRLIYSDVSISPTRLHGARADIQARVDGRLEPRLIELIRENDDLVPGFSLTRVFGID